MSLFEKELSSRAVDFDASDDGMPATTSICVALVVALILYVAGAAAFQRVVVKDGPQQAFKSEMSFHGP